MAPTYISIASTTLSSSAADITFSNIPGTYTDLVIRGSLRQDGASTAAAYYIEFNASGGTAYSGTDIRGNGSTASSTQGASGADLLINFTNAANNTANVFTNFEIYIPSYAGSANKPLSAFSVLENNSTTGQIGAKAGLWQNSNAITSIKIFGVSGQNFVTNSSIHLYGIKKD